MARWWRRRESSIQGAEPATPEAIADALRAIAGTDELQAAIAVARYVRRVGAHELEHQGDDNR